MIREPDTTSDLFDSLIVACNLSDFMKKHGSVMKVPLFHEYITVLCANMGLKQEAVINDAFIERTYGHQLFNGTRKPSRDKVIQLAFGFKMDVGDAQQLLKIACKSPLYPRIQRDAVFIYCLNKKKSIVDAQLMLQEFGLTLLKGEKKYG